MNKGGNSARSRDIDSTIGIETDGVRKVCNSSVSLQLDCSAGSDSRSSSYFPTNDDARVTNDCVGK